ncbi:MAG: hypothetical protein R2697_07110 [Ilumatobacteraceae bacterium]
MSRNSSEKMSSWTSLHGSRILVGLDTEQLLLVVPFKEERLALVEAFVALQADEAGAGHLGAIDFASWVLPVPAGPSTGLPSRSARNATPAMPSSAR